MTTEQAQAGAAKRQSRVGKRPIPIPKGVTVNVTGQEVSVQGPKGKLTSKLPDHVVIEKTGDELLLSSTATGDDFPRLQGLGRALVANMVKGCAEGFERAGRNGLSLRGKGQDRQLLARPVPPGQRRAASFGQRSGSG